MLILVSFLRDTALASWDLFFDASPYILFGVIVGGMLKMFLSTDYIARHLGKGRFLSVIKASLFGIPLPLCSCGVLPTAAALKKQGANNGATMAFLIATPESGVDSISITYALLDPLMAVARPVAALATALTAGCLENWFNSQKKHTKAPLAAQSFIPLPKQILSVQQSVAQRLVSGIWFALEDLWADLAAWFFLGVVLAGVITTLIPEEYISLYLGGGLSAMLLMLVFGVPLYICATASTPIAAALILKGVSPGAALVFLLVGPATNMASLSVLIGLLGKRATGLYLFAIAAVSVICGIVLDSIYRYLGVLPQAVIGSAAEIIPFWLQAGSAAVLVVFSFRPLLKSATYWWHKCFGGNKKN